MKANNQHREPSESPAAEGLARRLLKLLLTPLFGIEPRRWEMLDYAGTAGDIRDLPTPLAEPLLDLLIELRAERVKPPEFWSRWEALPAADPSQLECLRGFIESWLYWRERGMGSGIGGWAHEDPERTVRRRFLNWTIAYLEQKHRPSEIAAAPPPDARGDEPSPASTIQ